MPYQLLPIREMSVNGVVRGRKGKRGDDHEVD